jgi:hypothetical protein
MLLLCLGVLGVLVFRKLRNLGGLDVGKGKNFEIFHAILAIPNIVIDNHITVTKIITNILITKTISGASLIAWSLGDSGVDVGPGIGVDN